ncbi:cell wall hydrolase [Caldalkalibacillus salinus]|uniref:cell wall hydrolase n=1 Tax=Caldalkalibacillus salinus TaxID=2803787 RepID=UPI0019237419|nr:stalk domain-containing protein [Caldalkalibacillus salinus]
MNHHTRVLLLILLIGAGISGLTLVLAQTDELAETMFVVDGEEVAADDPIMLRDGRLFVPVRFVSQSLGAVMEWEQATSSLHITSQADDQMTFTLDSKIIKFNGEEYILDAAPFLHDGRTYLPVRHVAELLHAKVYWERDKKRVHIIDKPLHVVQEGETLQEISEAVDIPIDELRERNDIHDVQASVAAVNLDQNQEEEQEIAAEDTTEEDDTTVNGEPSYQESDGTEESDGTSEDGQAIDEDQTSEDGQETDEDQTSEDGETDEDQTSEDGQETDEDQTSEDGQETDEDQTSQDNQGSEEEPRTEEDQESEENQASEDEQSAEEDKLTEEELLQALEDYENGKILKAGQELRVVIPQVTENKLDEKELELLARIIYVEAGYEPFKGQVAVGNVVMNRVESAYFPNSIRDVIYQPNQFTPVRNGRFHSAVPSETAYLAAREVFAGTEYVGDALYFYNPRLADNAFFRSREVVADIANHRFLR